MGQQTCFMAGHHGCKACFMPSTQHTLYIRVHVGLRGLEICHKNKGNMPCCCSLLRVFLRVSKLQPVTHVCGIRSKNCELRPDGFVVLDGCSSYMPCGASTQRRGPKSIRAVVQFNRKIIGTHVRCASPMCWRYDLLALNFEPLCHLVRAPPKYLKCSRLFIFLFSSTSLGRR